MIKKISLFIASMTAALSFGSLVLVPVVSAQSSTSPTDATANINCGVTGDLAAAADGGCPVGNEANTTVNNTVTLVIRILQVVVGIISVIMIIFGGLKYITSGGDTAAVSSAKNTIIYACIGLLVVALAEVIVQFVLNRVNTVAT